MKFFKQEYLDYDYKDEIKRAEMNKLWKEACKSYSDYFRTIENSFSKRFIDLYYKHDGFHDAPIRSIIVEKMKKNKCNIRIALELNNIMFFMIYKNVISYTFNVPKDHKWFAGKMYWGYGEFELLSNGCMNHKILCLDNCEFDITCEKIYIKKKPNKL